ncbi:FtsK/SpoIIIE family DNA translocase [Hathewaya massiliensis]|uniref:FtsK/SpoIIIE family DNA translocase n=1 Tax=Hathewaya massiliensis TaxID=1964382 RepID=UPI00115A857B|nr:DNA translocase FtsK [Hathewaya massiliensis]
MARSKKTTSNKEIKGIILITVGILILLSLCSIFFENSSPGIIGKFIRNILFSFFGLGSYVLPFILIFIGNCYIIKKGKIQFNEKFYAGLTAIINTMLIIQMVYYNIFYDKSLINVFLNFYNSKSIVHGGFCAYLIDWPLKILLGKTGSYIVFCCVYIISFMILFAFSLEDIFIRFKNNITYKRKVFKENKNKKTKESIKIIDDTIDIIEKQEPSIAMDSMSINKIKVMDFLKSSNSGEEYYDEEKNESSYIEKEDSPKNEEDISSEIQKNYSIKNTNIDYKLPPLELLKENKSLKNKRGDNKELLTNASKLQDTLSSFGVNAKVVQVTKGPSVTRFEIQPETGVKVSKIVNLSDDIALNLAAPGIRIEAPIPGKAAIGIEVPNENLSPVFLREIIESKEYINSNKSISFALGKDIGGNSVVADLSKMPHLLVAGATGSGKSVCINTLIVSLLYKYSPKEVNLLLVDPKVVELSVYNGIPHLLIPVVTEPKKAAGALNWAVNEMTRRYNLFAENGVRNIEGYNELVADSKEIEKLSYIVIIIDELADLMMVCPKDVEDYIARLAQMARAAGMHLVIATQRPSVDVITGMIKANIPSRISFAVSSQIDSRTILDSSGAEKLLGKGDMLFYPVGESKPVRIQGAFISEKEVEDIVEFIKDQSEEVKYDEDIIEQIHSAAEGNSIENPEEEVDELLNDAINFVVESGYASTSMLQRKFKIGYNRAARIIDSMEERNVISQKNGSKPREVLISNNELNS